MGIEPPAVIEVGTTAIVWAAMSSVELHGFSFPMYWRFDRTLTRPAIVPGALRYGQA